MSPQTLIDPGADLQFSMQRLCLAFTFKYSIFLKKKHPIVYWHHYGKYIWLIYSVFVKAYETLTHEVFWIYSEYSPFFSHCAMIDAWKYSWSLGNFLSAAPEEASCIVARKLSHPYMEVLSSKHPYGDPELKTFKCRSPAQIHQQLFESRCISEYISGCK